MNRSLWAPTPLRCTLIDDAEFRRRSDERKRVIDAYQAETGKGYPDYWDDELRHRVNQVFPAGLMWFCPWYHDPSKPGAEERRAKAIAQIEGSPNYQGHLSIHYWRDWADKRPPINIICPDYRDWVVDAKSSNGDGWTVTGDAPLLVCTPSIWTSMAMGADSYHGFLGSNGAPPGHFSAPV